MGEHATASQPAGYTLIEPDTAGLLRLLRIGEVELDIDGRQLRIGGDLVHIPLKEFAVLETLMEHAGRVLSRRELLDAVWGSGYPDGNKTVDVHILRLRRKIRRAASGDYIRTVRGLGYVFDFDPH
jgi:DNA-binding response OmpR family regulator